MKDFKKISSYIRFHILYLKRKIKNFTLIELLIVISIIVILAGMLLPALNNAKKKAQQIACMNNLKQYGIVLAQYVMDNQEYYIYIAGAVANGSWNTVLRDNNYIRKSSKDVASLNDLNCPGFIREGDWKVETSYWTYMYNAVNMDIENWGNPGLGGGLRGAFGKDTGCKVPQLTRTSNFVVIAEACSGHRNSASQTTFNIYSMFCTIPRRFSGATEASKGGLGLAQHNNSSNYLMADGSVAAIGCNTITWYSFGLFPTRNTYCDKRYAW